MIRVSHVGFGSGTAGDLRQRMDNSQGAKAEKLTRCRGELSPDSTGKEEGKRSEQRQFERQVGTVF